MTIRLLLFIFFTSLISFELAQAFTFKKGEGSEFLMRAEGKKIELSIYISNVNKKQLGVEFHFGAGAIFASNMWQQFQMSLTPLGPIGIENGYIKTSLQASAEIMTQEQFYLNDGVQVQDFLFSKKEEISKYFIGDEIVELAAGVIISKHYRKKTRNQVVDFWISDQVKPIGLVKLVSKSEKKSNTYSIELTSLLKNVKPAINPKEATVMSIKTKNLLRLSAKK